jgi:predicted RNA binding protein YcfA (HicA-like mRNA interferase family)
MTKRLGNVKAREVRRLLVSLGYEVVPKRGKGSHEQYRQSGTGRWTTLSWKANDQVPTGTLKSIARDLGLTTAELLDQL